MAATFPFTTPKSLDSEPEAHALLEQAPVVRATMGPLDVWLALSNQAVRQVLTDSRFSREEAVRPGGARVTVSATNPLIMSSMDPPRHTRIRKLISSAFSPRVIAGMEPRIQEMVDGLIDDLGHPAELMHELIEPLPVMVICELLGAPFTDRERIREWASIFMAVGYPPERTHAAERECQAYLAELVAAKRAEPDGALISMLVGQLPEEELLPNLQFLLTAGHETTVNQLGNSIVTLLRHPGQLRLLIDNPDLIGGAVEELLRFSRLMATTVPRVAKETVVLDGVEVPAGATVFPVISSANRDPAAYPDPHRFDITREAPAPQLALGHGPHFCLGAQLAKMELRIAIGTLFRRHPELRVTSELTYKAHMAVRALEKLPVTW